MPRALSKELAAHLSDPQLVRVFDMVYLDLETSPLYLHNDIGVFEWNGREWYGVGSLGEVSQVVEDGLVKPGRVSVALNGLQPQWLADARSERHVGRDGWHYRAARNVVTGLLEGDPHLEVKGTMQAMDMQVGRTDASISLRLEDERAHFEETPGLWFSNAAQQAEHPGDEFFNKQDETARTTIRWGERGQNPYGTRIAPGIGGFHFGGLR